MATLKDVELKIKAVQKTRQITKAMNMVAASRLRSAQADSEAFRPYAAKFAEVLGGLAGGSDEAASPLLVPRQEVKNVHLVLCTSDRGLCGGFNANLIGRAESFCRTQSAEGRQVSITNFGKKGRDWCRREKLDIVDEYLGVVGARFSFNVAMTAGQKLVKAFLEEKYDAVYLIYAEFISMAKQQPVFKQLLPISPAKEPEAANETESEQVYMAEHVCEPSAPELLGQLLPRDIYVQIYNALLETSTSEHAARMMAMDNATKACNDMIENLTLAYNKARQAAITAELMDIVGGAEALRG